MVYRAKRRLVMISGAGDRRDCDLMAMTHMLGEEFDEVVLYEDACNRGRKDGEVMALLRKGLEGTSRAQAVTELRGEFKAIDFSLGRLSPGDLGLLLIDQVDAALAFLERRIEEVQGRAA